MSLRDSKQDANDALLKKITPFCVYIEHGDSWVSGVILNENFVVTMLHCVPEANRLIGLSVILYDGEGQAHETSVHGINRGSDYIVFRKKEGTFKAPHRVGASLLDKYIAAGFVYGEKEPAVRIGRISSTSSEKPWVFYGDSGGLPGFSGGGIFYARNGALMGIARGAQWKGVDAGMHGGVLEIMSVQIILHDIEFTQGQPFSV